MRLPIALIAAAAFGMLLPPGQATAQQQVDQCRAGTGEARVQACTDLIARGGSDVETHYFYRSVARFDLNDCEGAYADAEKALSLKRDAENLVQLGVMLLDCKNDYERAVSLLSDAIGLSPGIAKYYLDRGIAYTRLAKFDLALQDFDQAIRLDPREADYYYRRADLWADRGDLDKAISDYDRAIALDPKHASAYSYRGLAHARNGDDAKGLADLDRAIQIEPNNADSYDNRALFYRDRKDFDRALADNDKAVTLDPNATIYLGRAKTLRAKGDLVRARADFERVLKGGGGGIKSAHEEARAELAALDAAAAPARDAAKNAVQDQGRRVALVIGNGDYAHTLKVAPKLANPPRDAQAVAASLREAGFQSVTVAADQSREGLSAALRSFAREAEKADWGMVYYAGYGIEVDGVNYLIPVDAKLESDSDVQSEAVPLDQVMASVEGAGKLRLVVLDAFRDNPFAAQMRRSAATRSVGHGLGQVEPKGATLVVYAAKPGQNALDGDGANSPFAAALVKRMATPGIEISKMFRLVRDDVMAATAGRQEPSTYGSLPDREDFYFVSAQ